MSLIRIYQQMWDLAKLKYLKYFHQVDLLVLGYVVLKRKH